MTPETPAPKSGDGAGPTVGHWVKQIDLYDKTMYAWHERAKKIIKRYKDERSPREDSSSRYNILWSNVQTLLPALYAKPPKPDIERRFKDDDDAGRVAADVLERCTSYYCAETNFDDSLRQCVIDHLLTGRGTVWVRYVPHMRGDEAAQEGAQITDDTDEEPQAAVIEYEEVVTDYVHWQDFGHVIARTWDEVPAVWRRVYLDRDELVERFGEKGRSVPLDHREKDVSDRVVDTDDGKGTVYEIWDKATRTAYWLSKSVTEYLDVRPDPLGLQDFFPCPKPLFTTLSNDGLVPMPDYVQYQDQALEIDNLTARINSITKAVKVAGVYDASAEGVSRLLAEGVENQLVPVDQWAAFAEKGGIKGAVSFLPMEEITSTLVALHESRERVKEIIYEVTGLSDIIRGASVASETATAQQIKSNYATMRLNDRQSLVQKFARDVVRLIAQIIANHFNPETIKLVCGVRLLSAQEKQLVQMRGGQQTPPQIAKLMREPSWEDVFALLKNQPGRCFRIDIETDSIIKGDQQQDKQDRVEFLTAAGGFIQQALQAGAAQPALVPLLAEMLMFGVRAFPVGKSLEGSFEAAIERLEEQSQQPQQDPGQAQAQAEMQKQQMQFQADQAKAQSEQALEAKRIEGEQALEAQKIAQTLEVEKLRGAVQLEIEQLRLANDRAVRLEIARMEIDARRDIAAMQPKELTDA